ncbi:hypothetical protein [Actinoplanes xinjiangensis]|uniref:hypothetical protein n=1 Tax=Actinoplanes xinjiangensis TaxID=512350 RepID=UPI00341D6DD9
MVGETANAILGRRLEGENDEDQSARKEELASFEKRRTEAFESLPLLADGATIEAAHRLNEAVWALEQTARQGRTVTEAEWLALADRWILALNDFHAAARECLHVVGTYSRRDLAALTVDRPERRATSTLGGSNPAELGDR